MWLGVVLLVEGEADLARHGSFKYRPLSSVLSFGFLIT